ncbi:hypothetical protein ACTJKC_16180 [Pedobacter sp. 22226]|uniref:hypothetical protein n=1 Tax=Pedobacter sp. 22226 TaxID=3453894 RepID=UPI003F87FA10
MKSNTKKAAIYLLIIILYSCKNENKSSLNQDTNTLTMEILKKQIEAGASAEKFETDYPNYKYTEQDLLATLPILKERLRASGFKFLNQKEFINQVSYVFGRNIDFTSNNPFLILNTEDRCNKTAQFSRNDFSIELNPFLFYIAKSDKLLTELYALPEIFNYKDDSPEISAFESTMPLIKTDTDGEKIKIYPWKDVESISKKREKNLQTFIHRNKYIFNNDKASLAWLLNNDKIFLKTLALNFGYDKDPKINKMVLSSIVKEHINSTEFIGQFFFIKDCNNKLQIRKNLLKYVEENTSATDNRFIYALGYYMLSIYSEDLDKIFDEDPSKKFTDVEKAEIVANIANIENPAIEKYKSLESSDVWNKAGSSLYNISVSHPEVIKIIEQHNYFGLPKMKEIIAKLQEEAPPTGADPE